MKPATSPLSLLGFILLFTITPNLGYAAAPGAVEFSSGGFSVNENGVSAVIVVRRINLDGDAFSVSYSTSDGSARAGQDYQAASGTLTFSPYQTNATFTVTVLDDAAFEGIETVNLVLSNPTGGATLGSRSTATLTILDNESGGPGILDSSFDPGAGPNAVVRTVLSEANEGVFIGGDFTAVGGVPRVGLARLRGDGSIDAGFDARLNPGARIQSIVADGAGRLLVAGAFDNVGGLRQTSVAKLRQDGSLDASFAPGASVEGEVLSAAHQSDGGVLIVGNFYRVQGLARHCIARLLPTGQLDESFVPPTADGPVRKVVVQSDGAILLGGSFTTMNGAARTFVARLKANGTLDETFNPGDGNTVHNGTGLSVLALQADGKILVGGDFSILFGRGQSALMRLHPNGALDDSFGPNIPTGNSVWAASVQADGRVLIGGDFTRLSNPACCPLFNRNGIARLNPDGSVDESFDPGAGVTPQNVRALGVQKDQKLLAAGGFNTFDGQTRNGIARLVGDAPPRIQKLEMTSAQQVQLTISATPSRVYVIESSTDTVNWSPISTNVSPAALFTSVDTSSSGTDRKFYRVRQTAQ